jgi:hypothetical protein
MAFALQHGTAVRRLAVEIGALLIRVVCVVAHAILGPSPQAVDADQVQQRPCLFQKTGEPGAGIGLVNAVDGTTAVLHRVNTQVQVVLQLLC